MEVQLTPEQEAQLARIATQTGTNTERLVKDAVLRMLENKQLDSPVKRLPILHLGPMTSLHRGDIYCDV